MVAMHSAVPIAFDSVLYLAHSQHRCIPVLIFLSISFITSVINMPNGFEKYNEAEE